MYQVKMTAYPSHANMEEFFKLNDHLGLEIKHALDRVPVVDGLYQQQGPENDQYRHLVKERIALVGTVLAVETSAFTRSPKQAHNMAMLQFKALTKRRWKAAKRNVLLGAYEPTKVVVHRDGTLIS